MGVVAEAGKGRDAFGMVFFLWTFFIIPGIFAIICRIGRTFSISRAQAGWPARVGTY